MIFQWESNSATHYLRQLLSEDTVNKIREKDSNFSYMDLLSIGNGAIRPAGDSYRDQLANGEFASYGNEALDDFMKSTLGWMVYQEQIMSFLNQFCGFTMGEADVVRRGFAKKTGTEKFIPKIKSGFTETMLNKYGIEKEESDKLITNFIQVIEDASSYLFSYNHALPYSFIGYICGYLRYYYPVEFITTALNIFEGKEEKTLAIIEYSKKIGIPIMPIKFRFSRASYGCDVKEKKIYKGISSIKYMNSKVAEELYELKDNEYKDFVALLYDIDEKTSLDSRQTKILIELDFFGEFGDANLLLEIYRLFSKYNSIKQINKNDFENLNIDKSFMKSISVETEKMYRSINSKMFLSELCKGINVSKRTLKDVIKSQNEHLGYIDIRGDQYARMLFIMDINKKYTPRLEVYSLKNGTTLTVKIDKRTFNSNPLKSGDIIYVRNQAQKNKMKKNSEGGWDILDEKELWIKSYSLVHNL